jgi:hypothetical protein
VETRKVREGGHKREARVGVGEAKAKGGQEVSEQEGEQSKPGWIQYQRQERGQRRAKRENKSRGREKAGE